MPPRLLLAAVLCLGTLVVPDRLRAEEPFRMSPALSAQLARLECDVIGGRIKIGSPSIGGQVSSTFRGPARVQETLAIDLTSAWPRVDYQALAPEFLIHVSASGGDVITVERDTGDDVVGPRVLFKQQAEGPIEFSYRLGESSTVVSAPTLWHLWLIQPELCRRELQPLLRLLRPSWDLDKQATAIERAVISASRRNWTDQWPRWTELVAQLGDDDFGRRQAADRALRSAGLAAAPFLQNLDDSRLEAEQRSRVRRIVNGLTRFDDADTPDRASIWLVGDVRIWLALLDREDESTRRVAADKLREILGRPVAFDPTADPQTRRTQAADLARELRQAERDAQKTEAAGRAQ